MWLCGEIPREKRHLADLTGGRLSGGLSLLSKIKRDIRGFTQTWCVPPSARQGKWEAWGERGGKGARSGLGDKVEGQGRPRDRELAGGLRQGQVPAESGRRCGRQARRGRPALPPPLGVGRAGRLVPGSRGHRRPRRPPPQPRSASILRRDAPGSAAASLPPGASAAARSGPPPAAGPWAGGAGNRNSPWSPLRAEKGRPPAPRAPALPESRGDTPSRGCSARCALRPRRPRPARETPGGLPRPAPARLPGDRPRAPAGHARAAPGPPADAAAAGRAALRRPLLPPLAPGAAPAAAPAAAAGLPVRRPRLPAGPGPPRGRAQLFPSRARDGAGQRRPPRPRLRAAGPLRPPAVRRPGGAAPPRARGRAAGRPGGAAVLPEEGGPLEQVRTPPRPARGGFAPARRGLPARPPPAAADLRAQPRADRGAREEVSLRPPREGKLRAPPPGLRVRSRARLGSRGHFPHLVPMCKSRRRPPVSRMRFPNEQLRSWVDFSAHR